ncbi:MAG TPA: sel1 repeat family protein [Gammaproteobacteria bacterium]|nr:sel1 repeat family protein [Gammaproteobacteria bacterium]
MRRLLSFFLLFSFLAVVQAGALEDGARKYREGDYLAAYRLWKPLADAGNADAQYNIALLLMNGEGVKKNDREALFLFLEAARQGHAEAQYNAGYMFAAGRGIATSYIDAKLWWERAAEQGIVAAQYNLGVLYAFGRGVGVDNERAIGLWRKAAKAGYEEARRAMAIAYENGWFGLEKDPDKARQWRQTLPQ